ncbi:hypothetical protein EVJ58_g2569 [Rhodofomes roseus]|uniref:Uncharacterized protein n=1 Tax=Rhodofomes roseus TaxID=34475 RepID=A0A4Y9YRY0_9APHY|nr:hypothetical protein EVJ58_g2569 [Rhodofomes roseus]
MSFLTGRPIPFENEFQLDTSAYSLWSDAFLLGSMPEYPNSMFDPELTPALQVPYGMPASEDWGTPEEIPGNGEDMVDGYSEYDYHHSSYMSTTGETSLSGQVDAAPELVPDADNDLGQIHVSASQR